MAHFNIPRNLPHAATIARRIEHRILSLGIIDDPQAEDLIKLVESLVARLESYEGADVDPPEEEANNAAEESAELARGIVWQIEALNLQEDRLGQTIRNLFECLGLGEEGADISLRAGEDPKSLMRPYGDE